MCGSTTCSTRPAPTAASNGLPPGSRTARPAAEASQWVEATMPNVPASCGRVVNVDPWSIICPPFCRPLYLITRGGRARAGIPGYSHSPSSHISHHAEEITHPHPPPSPPVPPHPAPPPPPSPPRPPHRPL